MSVSGVEVGVEVIRHSNFRSRYPFKKRIHVKNGYRLKPEFYKIGFLTFDRLIFAPNVLIGSENWLVRLCYNQESIPNVVYIFRIFLCSEMKGVQCLIMPQLHIWTLPQKHGYRPKTNYLLFHLDTSQLIL